MEREVKSTPTLRLTHIINVPSHWSHGEKKKSGDEKKGQHGRDDDLEQVETMHQDSTLHRLPLHFGLWLCARILQHLQVTQVPKWL